MLDERERVVLMFDGANVHATARALGFDIDYKALLKYFRRQAYVLRAIYYTATVDDSDYSSIRPLIDWLDYNGYSVVTKPAKSYTDSSGQRRFKGNMDMEIAVDALDLADRVDHIVLFSGNGDFRRLIEALQRRGRRVSVVSTMETASPMIADELRRQADQFIDLASLEDEVGREPSMRRSSRLEEVD